MENVKLRQSLTINGFVLDTPRQILDKSAKWSRAVSVNVTDNKLAERRMRARLSVRLPHTKRFIQKVRRRVNDYQSATATYDRLWRD